MSAGEDEIRDLLAGALDLEGEERAAYLERASDDPELRREVLELLRELEDHDGFLDQPAIALAEGLSSTEPPLPMSPSSGSRGGSGPESLLDILPTPQATETRARTPGQRRSSRRRQAPSRVGKATGAQKTTSRVHAHKLPNRIGPYRRRQPLGGGAPSKGLLGRLYRAERIEAIPEPSHREVALRIAPLAGPLAVSEDYFARLQRFTVRLAHPNIARVYEHGRDADQDLVYLASELVHDGPITTFCDHRRLDVDTRLELFETLCEAIRHAHQKGVLHLDLRPSNLLMTLTAGRPTPKVVDFGLMAELDPAAPASPLHRGRSAGPTSYLAPEAERDPAGDGVDTRTDVYALGMLLDELLIGTISGETSGFYTLAAGTHHDDPDRPSLRFEMLHDSAARQQAALRATTPARLLRRLQGELDAIIATATAEHREQRYPTVDHLLADLNRHRAGRPTSLGARRGWRKIGHLFGRGRA